MTRIQLSFASPDSGEREFVTMDVLDPATALVIAAINGEDGPAELWDGQRRLARLVRRGDADAPFWEVG